MFIHFCLFIFFISNQFIFCVGSINSINTLQPPSSQTTSFFHHHHHFSSTIAASRHLFTSAQFLFFSSILCGGLSFSSASVILPSSLLIISFFYLVIFLLLQCNIYFCFIIIRECRIETYMYSKRHVLYFVILLFFWIIGLYLLINTKDLQATLCKYYITETRQWPIMW